MKSFLKKIWSGWKAFGRKAGDLQAKLLLNLFYFVILPPFAMIYRLSRSRSPRSEGWLARNPGHPPGYLLPPARSQY